MNVDYNAKYLKYKKKYLELKKQIASQQTGGSTEKLDIMLFKANWCGHCKNFIPTWNEIQTKYKSKYNFVTYDSEANKKEMKQWQVQGYPTIIIKKGNLASEYKGDRVESDIIKFVENLEN